MVNFWSISLLLVLLEPVNRADSKYVFAVWIGSQIREIYEKTLAILHIIYIQNDSISINGSKMVNFQYFNKQLFIGIVRTSQSCRFQICICCLDQKSNTGDIYCRFAMSCKVSFGADFAADFLQTDTMGFRISFNSLFFNYVYSKTPLLQHM